MFKLEEFKQLVRDFSDVADFLVVYIAEAHSTGQSHLRGGGVAAGHNDHQLNVKRVFPEGLETVYLLNHCI